MRLVDAHAHLDDEAFQTDLDQVVKRAKQKSVIAVVSSSLDLEGARRTLALARRFAGFIFPSIGWDPTSFEEEEMEAVRQLIGRERNTIVAVGEVGLDYYWVRDAERRKLQVKLFREWIDLARSLDLPLVVHSRSAGKYAIQVLLEEGYDRVLLHAFDGRAGWALRAIQRGMFVSIPTSIVRSQQKQRLAKLLPIENLLLETDSPVLAPVRTERNEPANLVVALREVARIKGLPEDQVAEITTENAIRFFHLPL